MVSPISAVPNISSLVPNPEVAGRFVRLKEPEGATCDSQGLQTIMTTGECAEAISAINRVIGKGNAPARLHGTWNLKFGDGVTYLLGVER